MVKGSPEWHACSFARGLLFLLRYMRAHTGEQLFLTSPTNKMPGSKPPYEEEPHPRAWSNRMRCKFDLGFLEAAEADVIVSITTLVFFASPSPSWSPIQCHLAPGSASENPGQRERASADLGSAICTRSVDEPVRLDARFVPNLLHSYPFFFERHETDAG